MGYAPNDLAKRRGLRGDRATTTPGCMAGTHGQWSVSGALAEGEPHSSTGTVYSPGALRTVRDQTLAGNRDFGRNLVPSLRNAARCGPLSSPMDQMGTVLLSPSGSDRSAACRGLPCDDFRSCRARPELEGSPWVFRSRHRRCPRCARETRRRLASTSLGCQLRWLLGTSCTQSGRRFRCHVRRCFAALHRMVGKDGPMGLALLRFFSPRFSKRLQVHGPAASCAPLAGPRGGLRERSA